MTTELNTNKYYIVESKYPTEEYPKYFKMQVKEVTAKTYVISNIDTIMFTRQATRYSKEDFNLNFSIIEEMDNSMPGTDINIDGLIMNARNYGKNTLESYYPKWRPLGPTLD